MGATVPLVPGTCTPAEDERAGITNNDVYTGPYDTTDNDGDGLVNEDNVDGEDDVVDMDKIINDFALIRNQWLGITKGLDQKQWQITNIVKLRMNLMHPMRKTFAPKAFKFNFKLNLI